MAMKVAVNAMLYTRYILVGQAAISDADTSARANE